MTAVLDRPRAAKHNKYIGQVDREAGIIRHCKILGTESRRGRTYPLPVIQRAAPFYEGAPVNVDHIEPGARRSLRDRIGRIHNVSMENDGLYGDFHANKSHPLYEQIMDDAEHAPQNLGFSHDTRGTSHNENGKVVVDSIDKLLSVDLVANPASTSGLFESYDSQEDDSPFPEIRQALHGRREESPIFRAARLARTVERFSRKPPTVEEVLGEPVPLLEEQDAPPANSQDASPFAYLRRRQSQDSATLAHRIARFTQPGPTALIEDDTPDPELDDLPEDDLQESWSPAARAASAESRRMHLASGQLPSNASPAEHRHVAAGHRKVAKRMHRIADWLYARPNLTQGQRRVANMYRIAAEMHEAADKHHTAHAEALEHETAADMGLDS